MPFFADPSPWVTSTFSGNAFIDGLLVGAQMGAGAAAGTTTITYSFPWANGGDAYFSYGNEANSTTTAAFTAEQRLEIAGAFNAWAAVANLNFVEVAEDADGNVGDIRVAMSDAVGDWWGWAYFPGGHPAAGDIWVHTRYANDDFSPGTYNFYATIHEIGHALGLDHTFDGLQIPAGYDDRRYSVMSYADPAGAWWYDSAAGRSVYLISGPMVYDILAIQYLYGANMSYEAGDSVYAFKEDEPFIKAIWDAGGTDLIDLSDFSVGCTLDLEPGQYSTTSFINHNVSNNLGIAFGAVIENLLCGSGDDRAYGNAAANELSGGAGHDVLFGRDGDDLLDGGDGDDELDGGDGFNRLVGGGGNDTLINGMAAYDTAVAAVMVDLGAGTATSRAAGDLAGIGVDALIYLTAARGSSFDDLMIASDVGCALYGLAGDDTLAGAAGNDFLDGGAGSDVMTGGGGDDMFICGAGDDWIDGGDGLDQLSFADALAGVEVSLEAGLARALGLGSAGIGTNQLASVEWIIGSGFGDYLAGDAAGNMLIGAGGDDVLTGGAGNDMLDGGDGLDQLTGGVGNDLYVLIDSEDEIIEIAGQGRDEVLSSVTYTLGNYVEVLTLAGSAVIQGFGNDLANLISGNAASNRLYGMGGDDRLYGGAGNDRLDGGLQGTDRMWGGTGNDVYYVRDATDYAIEYAGEGIDLVFAWVDHILRANVENLTLVGIADIFGRGNGAANAITGNAGANRLFGLLGDDTLSGAAGNDVIGGGAGRDVTSGGTGADLFVFASGDFAGMGEGTADRILDFNQVEGDRIRLSTVDANSMMEGSQAFAFIGAEAFSNVAGQLRYEQIAGNSYIMGDTDGDGNADFWIRLDGLHTLGSGDFIL